jgi:lipopolysaccharide biosynthesis protein
MSIYLQDAIKIILDRRDEKPLDILNEYFNTTLKGEHILLREYAFVSATQLNRKSFLQQVKKVFHSTPHYKVITALDYQQMICLVCSDFPRQLIIETVKTLPIAGAETISAKQGHELLFEQFDIDKLQQAVCIHFYYTEFMENVRTLFQESST